MNTSQSLSPEWLRIFESVPDAYLILSTDFTILTASDAYLKATSATRETIRHRSLFEVFAGKELNPESLNNLRASLEYVLATRQPHQLTWHPVSIRLEESLEQAYWQWLHTPVFGENGQLLCIIQKLEVQVSQTRIAEPDPAAPRTNPKPTGKNWQQDVALLELVLENTSSSIMLLQPVYNAMQQIVDLEYVFINQQALQSVFKESLVGQHFLQQFPGATDLFAYYVQVIETGTAWSDQVHINFDGFDVWAQVFANKVHSELLVTYIDITQRKKAEQEIELSQRLFRATIDSSLDLIQVFEAVRNNQGEIVDFIWIFINAASEKVYGDVIGKSLLSLNPGVIQEGIFDTFKRVAETGIPDQSERHYVHEQFNGWFYQSTRKLNDGVTTTTSNITERKKAELEVQQSKTLLQNVIDAPNIGMAVYKALRNERGEIVDFVHEYINRASISMLDGEDFTGRLFTDHGENALEQMPKFIEVIETGKGNQYAREAELNGKKFWFAITNTPLDPDRLVHTWEDITEQKVAERKLRESKELIQTVFDVSLNPIAYYKAIRNEKGNIVDFEFLLENRKARRYAEEDHKGKRYSEAYPGIKDTAVFEMYCDVVETGTKMDTEVRLALKGTERWFHVMAVKLDDGLVATALDVTERKKAEVEILRLKDEVAQKATDKYYSIFNSIDEGFAIQELIYDQAGIPVDVRLVEANPAHEKLTGLKNVVGKTSSELGMATEDYWYEKYDHVVKTGQPLRFENFHAPTQRWYNVFLSRIGGVGSTRMAMVFNDMTERKEREQLREYLLRLNDALRLLADPLEVQRTAMQVLGEHLKVDRVVYADVDGEDFVLNDNYIIPGTQKLIGRFPFAAFGSSVARLQKGENVIVDDVSLGEYEDAEKQNFYALGVHSVIAVPLIKNGTLVADLSIHHQKPRYWKEDEIVLIQETAERTWAAVERTRAEEALRKSQKRFESIANLVPDLLWDSEPDGSTNWYNQRWLEYTGQSFEQAIGWGWVEAIHPNDREGSAKRYREAVKAGKPLRQEHRIRRYDGEYRWFVVSTWPLKDPSGQVIKMYGAATDIDDRKQAEESLRNSEQQLRLFTVASSSMIYRMSADWTKMEILSGRQMLADTDEPINDWVEKYLPAQDRSSIFAVIDEAIGRKSVFDLEHRVFTANGDIGWVHSRAVPLLDANGEIQYWFGAGSDITQRRRVQEALQKSEKRFRTLFNSIDEGFYLCEVIFDEHKKPIDILYLEENPAAIRMIGQSFVGRRLREISPSYEPYWYQIWGEVALTGVSKRMEQYSEADDKWFDFFVSKVDSEDSRQIIVVFQNVTERRQREQQQQFLLRLSDTLRPLNDPLAIEHSVTRVAMEYFGSDRCYYCQIEDDQAIIRRDAAKEGLPSVANVYSLNTLPILQMTINTAKPFVVYNVRDTDLVDESLRALCVTLQVISFMNIPVIKESMPVGMLCVVQSTPRNWTNFEISLAEEVAERTWAAVERAKAESEWKRSEIRLRALVENLPGSAVFILDKDLCYVLAQGEALQVTGFSPDDFIGKTVDEVLPAGTVTRYRPYFEKVLSGQNFFYEHADHGRWFISRGVPLHSADGEVEAVLVVSYDITQRKEAEEQIKTFNTRLEQQVLSRTAQLKESRDLLAESRDLLQSVFDTNLMGMSVLEAMRDVNGQIEDFTIRIANKELERVTGRTDLVGKRYAQEYPGIRGVGIFDLMLQVMDTGRPAGMEYYYTHEGFDQWFSCQFVKLGDGLVATNLDISERKQAEAEVHTQLAILQQAEELAQMGSWEYDLLTGEFNWSEGMYRLFSLPVGSNVKPKIYLEYSLLGDLPLARRLVYGIRRGKPPVEITLRIRQGQGSKTLRIRTILIRNAQAKAVKVLGVDMDITAAQLAEQTILEGQQLLQAVFDVSPIGIVVAKAVRDSDGKIVDFVFVLANREVEELSHISGLPGKSLLTELKALTDLSEPELAHLLQSYIEVVETGVSFWQEQQIADRWFSISSVKFDDGLVTITEDITDRKRMEEEYLQLHLSQQKDLLNAILEAQEQERTRISESLHNGLGQLLFAAKLNLQTYEYNPASPEEKAGLLTKATELITEAIGQTRTLSFELTPTILKDFGLAATVEYLLQKLSTPLLPLKCHIENVPEKLDSQLELSVFRITQVLIGNVLAHSQATEAYLRLTGRGPELVLEVNDNGKGFDPEKVSSSTTGMGLRTVLNRVALLGGTLHMDAAPGKGTKIKAALPLIKGQKDE